MKYHLSEKLKSREEKTDDIAKFKANKQIITCLPTDLEAVIPLFCEEVSDFYSKSEINVINFTIFDMSNREGF